MSAAQQLRLGVEVAGPNDCHAVVTTPQDRLSKANLCPATPTHAVEADDPVEVFKGVPMRVHGLVCAEHVAVLQAGPGVVLVSPYSAVSEISS